MPFPSDIHPPGPGPLTVTYTAPGGVACHPFAEGYVTMRVCLGHIYDIEHGLIIEVENNREPVPWQSLAVRAEAITTLRHRAERTEGDERSMLNRLMEHALRTPYYDEGA